MTKIMTMPTIRQVPDNTLDILYHSGYRPGKATYDDLLQAVKQLKRDAPSTLDDKLEE